MNQFPYLNQFPMQSYGRYLPSAYDNSTSIYQQVIRLIEHVNQQTKLTNSLVEYLNEFIRTFDEKLYRTVSDVLIQWEKDGKLAEIVGNSLVGFKNVYQFGVKGDGINDDHDGLQKALDQKGYLYIPKGTYRTTKRLYIFDNTHIYCHPDARIWLDGDDYTIAQNGKPDDCFSGYNGNGNITIEGGIWDCGGSNDPDFKSLRAGFMFAHGENITFRNVTIDNVYEVHHIEINSSKNVLIENCNFLKFYGGRTFAEAIQIDGAFNDANFPPFGTWDNTLCNGVTVQNCYFANHGAGIGTHVTKASMWHENINILYNKFENLKTHAIHLQNMKEVNIIGNNGKNMQTGVLLEGCYDVIVSDNTFKDCSGSGLQYANCTFVRSEYNTIGRCANGTTQYQGSKQNTYVGNRISDCTANGLNFTGGDLELIEGNSVVNCASHGIFLHDTVTKTIVKDNILKDNQLSGISMNAVTLTKVKDNIVEGNGKNGINANINILQNCDYNVLERNILRKNNISKFNIAVDVNAGQNNELNLNDDEDGNALANKVILVTRNKKELELKNDWTNFDENVKMSYQVDGNQILLSGVVKVGKLGGTDTDDVMVCQLPVIARPRQAQFSVVGGTGGGASDFARVNIFPSGRIVVPTVGEMTAIDFSNIKLVIR